MPEALETWGLPLFASLLPRPLEIIYEINGRFLDERAARYPGDDARVARMSLIDEGGDKRVRMANLATVGSHAVNGVAELHSALLKETVLRDFAELWPERFCNVTNGVTPRRFLVLTQPGARAAARRDGRRGMGHRPRAAQRPSKRTPATRRFASDGGRSSGSTRRRSRFAFANAPASWSIRRRCSTSRSSASTSTSAST